MKPRAAVLGASHWHVPVYLNALAEGAHLVAVSDPDTELAGRVAAAFGAHVYSDWRSVLDIKELDLAFAFGRHCEMPAIARGLIERRLPFMIEKPGGISLSDVSGIAELARESGVPAVVPFVQRFGPLRNLLKDISPLEYGSFRYLAGPPARYPRAGCGWMLDPSQAGGGCLINLGFHFIDLFGLLVAEPIALVCCRTHRRAHNLEIEDHAIVLLETRSGRSAVIEVGYTVPDSPRKESASYSGSGRNGCVSIGDDGTVVIIDADGRSRVERIDLAWAPLIEEFVRRVLRGLDSGFEGLPGLDDLKSAMRVIDLAYTSAAKGQCVPV